MENPFKGSVAGAGTDSKLRIPDDRLEQKKVLGNHGRVHSSGTR